MFTYFQKGQSLVELLVVIALAAILLPALLTGLISSREGRPQEEKRMQAVAMLKETENAVRSVKANDWVTFSAYSGTYHPVISGSRWTLATSSATVNGLTQQVVISDAQRNTSTGAIVSGGGTVDPSTKRADITVSWTQPLSSSVTSTLYFTRINNQTYSNTTVAQFTLGTASNSAVASTSGSITDGQVQLGAGGGGDWCNPNLSITALDLPKNGVANAISAIEGQVFAGTGENSSGVSFANIGVTNTNPPDSSIEATFDGYKTNDVFGEANYAYLSTDNNSKEVVIIDLNQIVNGKYQEVGYFNTSATSDGLGVYVSGNVGYLTAGSTLYTFNLSSKSGSRSQLDSITLPGTGNKIMVNGNYAYVAVGTSSKEMQIVDVSDPSNLSLLGYTEVDPQNQNSGDVATDVFVNDTGTRAYVVIEAASGLSEFFIIDISTKTGSRPIVGSYEANGMSPKAVTVVTGNKAIIVGTNGQEYQVIDISDETSPVSCGGINIDSGVNGISSVLEQDEETYSYIITGDATAELKIIQGGSGSNFSTSGTFESAPYNAGVSSAFNRFVATVSQPSATSITLQVAVRPLLSGTCPTASSAYTYVGPNGNPSAYFTSNVASISGIIPFGSYMSGAYENPQQCFRYKTWFTSSDNSQTPILYDMTWNYSQ